ncbi:MAG TPA: hypothetical protein VHQ24_03750, partial [Lachnospiraceae bacterium]|nr:hypothetical protein [Lachnospiraceae bacterium]
MEKSSFFNAVITNGVSDRSYLAEDFANYFASFIGNGVFPLPSTGLQLIANGDMTVTMKAGSAWINGYYYINTDDLIFKLTAADGVLKRVDRLVIRCSFADREIRAIVKQGSYSNSPVANSLQRDADAYELGIADIFVNNGAISITQSCITDLRLNSSYCGYVKGVIEQVDTTTIFNQFSAWYAQFTSGFETSSKTWQTKQQQSFMDWFTKLQSILDENIAAKLQKQIDGIVQNGVSKAENAMKLEGKAASEFSPANHTHTKAAIG